MLSVSDFNDLISETLEHQLNNERFEAEQKLRRVKAKYERLEIECRSRQVSEINMQIKSLEILHQKYLRQFNLIPEESRTLSRQQLAAFERELYLNPIQQLKRLKHSKSKSR